MVRNSRHRRRLLLLLLQVHAAKLSSLFSSAFVSAADAAEMAPTAKVQKLAVGREQLRTAGCYLFKTTYSTTNEWKNVLDRSIAEEEKCVTAINKYINKREELGELRGQAAATALTNEWYQMLEKWA